MTLRFLMRSGKFLVVTGSTVSPVFWVAVMLWRTLGLKDFSNSG